MTEEAKEGELRGSLNLTLGEDHPNFMFLLGTEPSRGVRADTKLISDALLMIK